jgi:S1-C subfamily serine protease
VKETDAAINNGNSGGPLIDSLGQVIGINTLVVRSSGSGNIAEGLGFAIPSNLVRDIASELIATGKVEHPCIGIAYQQIDPQVAASLNLNTMDGVIVTQVDPSNPARKRACKRAMRSWRSTDRLSIRITCLPDCCSPINPVKR